MTVELTSIDSYRHILIDSLTDLELAALDAGVAARDAQAKHKAGLPLTDSDIRLLRDAFAAHRELREAEANA